MLASAALITSLLKSQLGGKDIVLDDVAVEKVAASLGLDSDASSTTTASQTTVVDAGVRLRSKLDNLVYNLVQESMTEDKTRLLHINHVIEYISCALSDMVFIYPGTSSTHLGQGLLPWDESLDNISGKSVKVVRMDTRDGALHAVQGALEHGDIQATVLASSQSLYSMLPMLHLLVGQQAPVVFHVAGHGINGALVSRTELDAVVAARQSGAVLLSSSSVQEAHDMAVVARVIAQQLQAPVIHYFDGTLVNRFEKVNVCSYKKLALRLQTGGSSVPSILSQHGFSSSFGYFGSQNAETVLVTLAAHASSSLVRAVESTPGVGLLSVRAYRPWQDDDFLHSVVPSARQLVVLEQGDGLYAFNGALYLDVASAVRFGSSHLRVVTAQAPGFGHLTSAHLQVLAKRASSASFVDLLDDKFEEIELGEPSVETQAGHGSAFRAAYWDVEQDGTAVAGSHIAQLVHEQDPEQAGICQIVHDGYRVGGGVTHTQIACNTNDLASNKVNYIGVHNIGLVNEYDILAEAAQGAKVLLHGPWQHGDDLESVLPNSFKLRMTQLDIDLYTLDATQIVQEAGLHQQSAHVVDELAFLLLNSPKVDPVDVLSAAYQDGKRDVNALLAELAGAVQSKLTRVALLPPWTILETDDAVLPALPLDRGDLTPPVADDIEVQDDKHSQLNVATWHKAAWQMMFKEAYHTDSLLRPDLHENNYLVTLSVNRRLTPATYDRNVFHLEFDTSASGLKYELGDALGVHGHNDSDEVKQFLQWYGLDETDVVTVPVGVHAGSRTVFQLFSQVLDIFGRPSKKFYEGLATVAADDKEKQQLEFLISAEGKDAFKARVEDTVTYEDLLHEFPSARPSLEQLMAWVSPIKPRHYSIASSQKMHGNSVHLLVVAVDWVNRAGKPRFGQCTRYLANLAVGSQVTVSIKPSVMKLPPLDSQPVIMAGLGTGMAPFRAFIQERYMAKQAGKQVGPVVLYFGSRNRSNEYLYGEELEAYHQDGVLSHMGLAFSRDQKQKVYIQHKMKEDAAMLSDYLINNNGHFYLCGPTWPVPDVKDAVVHGLTTFGSIQEAEANALIEEWKEKERYILEVY
ncbi:hypothetical protein BC940DRAFT_264732 [Gongronella butleri]|nr:hypothetical protein BC940DRAFT_264732 [Gongronella butleri]